MKIASRVVFFLLPVVACGTQNPPDLLVVSPVDAGTDAGDAAPVLDADVGEASPYLGAACVDDGQCNDGIACTYDSCDRAVGRCLNVPDDTQCDDGNYCDGKELCVVGHGCEPGAVVNCSDGNPCDLSRCDEPTKSCQHSPRDVDQDGDPDDHCPTGGDCNDLDPNVSSKHAEVCGNGIDDNCNGLIDEEPCVAPQGNTCADAIAAPAAGLYELTTVGNEMTVATSCSVTHPASGQTAITSVTVPPGVPQDLEVWATTSGVEVAVAIQGVCGQASSELACGSGAGATSVRARARGVAPGTYSVVVTTQTGTAVELQVSLGAATTAPTDVDCPTATPMQTGTPTAVSILGGTPSLPSACSPAIGDLTYSFVLAAQQDVRVFASTQKGSGSPVVGLRDPACTGQKDELGCVRGSGGFVYARALRPGKYVVTVGATSPIDASVEVELSPPSPTPADESCASPPAIAANASLSFDLANHALAIQDGCFATQAAFAGGAAASYDLALPTASDVLLVERLGQTDTGAVSLDAPACAMAMACSTGGTPVRTGLRNVAAGDYRAVVADELSLGGTLDALVRPTVAPSIVPPGGADTCATAIDASAGGFFTGDTSTAMADYSNPCDAPTSSGGGAPDQVLTLNLAQPQRVVFDMEGSTYTTILDIRQGPACPGTPVTNGCYAGFTAQRSFLDLELAAGQYWAIVDGYQGMAGPWNLDVRVLPP